MSSQAVSLAIRELLREGVELSTGFTANIDAQLGVGALEETITVTQASPSIDVQSIEQRETIDADIFETLPTARQYDSLALLVLSRAIADGANLQDLRIGVEEHIDTNSSHSRSPQSALHCPDEFQRYATSYS